MVDTALVAIDSLTELIEPFRAQLQCIGAPTRCPGLVSLRRGRCVGRDHLGGAGRLPTVSNSDQAVRFSGLDITVYSSDGKRSPGRLARQGSPVLRWALFEAAKSAARSGSPDHDYYVALSDRLGGKRPALSVARKLARRCYHALRTLGDEAWAPLESPAENKAA